MAVFIISASLMMFLLLVIATISILYVGTSGTYTTTAPTPTPAPHTTTIIATPGFELLVMQFLKAEGAYLGWDLHRLGFSMLAEAPALDALPITTVFPAGALVALSNWMVDEGYSSQGYPHSAKFCDSDGEYDTVYLWVRVLKYEDDEEEEEA